MSYRMTARSGFGYTTYIDTPVGKQKITIPLEQMAKDAAVIAANEAWPIMRDQVYNELPNLVNAVQPKIRFEIDRATKNADLMADRKIDEVTKRAAIGVGILIVLGGATAAAIIAWPSISKRL